MPDNHLDARIRIIAKEEIAFEFAGGELGGRAQSLYCWTGEGARRSTRISDKELL
jgi:hypothetical protein